MSARLRPLFSGAFLFSGTFLFFLVLWPGTPLGQYNGVRSYIEVVVVLTALISIISYSWFSGHSFPSIRRLHIPLLLVPIYFSSQAIIADDRLMGLESAKLAFFTLFAWLSACMLYALRAIISWPMVAVTTILAASSGFLAETAGLIPHAVVEIPLMPMLVELSHQGGSAFGGFGQKNVFASFLAAISIWLLALRTNSPTFEVKQALLECVAIFLTAGTLMILGSKVGLIGFALPLCCLCRYQFNRCYSRYTSALIYCGFTGLLAGYVASELFGMTTSIDRLARAATLDSSTSIRFDAIKLYLLLMLDQSWFGSDLPFLWSVQGRVLEDRSLIGHDFATQIFSLRHGHNMLLQWFFEYGVIGVVLIFCPYVFWVTKLTKRPVNQLLLMALSLFPIVLHFLVEFPLLTSSFHWVLLVIIPISFTNNATTLVHRNLKRSKSALIQTIGAFLFLGAGYLAYVENRSHQTLLTQNYIQEWADYQQSNWHWMSDPVIGVLAQDLAVSSMAQIFVESGQHEMLPFVLESSERILRNYPSEANYKRHIYLLDAMDSQQAVVLQGRLDSLIALRDGVR